MSFTTNPFTIAIPQERLDELSSSLTSARLPPSFYEGTRPDFGTTTEWLRGALDEWKNKYDWRQFEQHLNKFNHFLANVPYKDTTFKVHYIHHKATGNHTDPAIPLLLMHGWPGSFLEFTDVIEPLSAANFDVVVASLPGFTFGEKPPVDREFARDDVASIFDSLMQGLGYKEYAAQGGDLGSHVARLLSTDYTKSCKAAHMNFFLAHVPEGFNVKELPQDEQDGLKKTGSWLKNEWAYGLEHGTKPSTISHVIYSSPVALLAWIGEKYISWTDKTPSMKKILDSITLWYLTDTFPTSIYFYRETRPYPPPYIHIPFGYTWNKFELIPTPISLVATQGNLLWSRKHQEGGHFFALERPEVFVQDMKDCFAELWPKREV